MLSPMTLNPKVSSPDRSVGDTGRNEASLAVGSHSTALSDMSLGVE